jgi:hypothetical protein
MVTFLHLRGHISPAGPVIGVKGNIYMKISDKFCSYVSKFYSGLLSGRNPSSPGEKFTGKYIRHKYNLYQIYFRIKSFKLGSLTQILKHQKSSPGLALVNHNAKKLQ